MNRRSARRVDELLRSDAEAVRRHPSPALGARVRSTMRSRMPSGLDTPAPDLAETSLAETSGFGRRIRDVCVAASVLAAAGLWIFAFAGGIGSETRVGETGRGGSLARSTSPAREGSDPSGLLAQLARVTPRALGTAVDQSLLGELDRIAQDATRTARFLASRVPSSLVSRSESALR